MGEHFGEGEGVNAFLLEQGVDLWGDDDDLLWGIALSMVGGSEKSSQEGWVEAVRSKFLELKAELE